MDISVSYQGFTWVFVYCIMMIPVLSLDNVTTVDKTTTTDTTTKDTATAYDNNTEFIE